MGAPTHTVPEGGLPTWTNADPSSPTGPRLDPRLPVTLVESRGSWARVECANGWTAWVDGRQLVTIGARGGVAGAPTAPAYATPAYPAPAYPQNPYPTAPHPAAAPPAPGGWGPGYAPTPAYVAPSSTSRGVPVVGAIGAAVVALSSILPWGRGAHGFRGATAFKIPVGILFTLRPTSDSVKLGLLVLVLGLVSVTCFVIGSAGGRAAGRIAGALGLLVAGLYVIQIARLYHDLGASGFYKALGVGVYVCAIGGALALVGGNAPRRS